MKEKDLFLENMVHLGVKKLGDQEMPAPLPIEAEPLIFEVHPDHEERAEFLRAVADLQAVPDKDRPRPAQPSSSSKRIKLARRKNLSYQDCLDLHGYALRDALDAVANFVARGFATGLKTLVIITGKGRHSAKGTSVLKPAVEQWIVSKGKRFIKAYAEAPRAYGGSGALIVYLREN